MKIKEVGIYKITSPSGKIYIGQSINIKERWRSHKKLYSGKSIRLNRSLIKYGSDNHIFEIIELCCQEILTERECYWIKFYDTFDTKHGLNLKEPNKGGRLSKETIEKIRKSNTGKKLSEKHKQLFCYSNKGIKRTKEQLITLSKAHLGIKLKPESIAKRTASRDGYKHSEETKEKTRESVKNSWLKRSRFVSEETRKKMSNTRKKLLGIT